MKKKKNRFWLFVFSLWPGAGHMYIGFMKTGLSFMLGFLLPLAVVAITNIGPLAVIPITVYVYAFFHANNIGGLDDEEFAAMEDKYLFGFADMDQYRLKLDRKNRNIAAAVLIILGISMLWNVGFGIIGNYVGWDNPVIRVIYYTLRDDVPRVVIALVIIWVGVRLLRGKKEEMVEADGNRADQVVAECVEKPVVEIEQKDDQKEA